MKILITSDIHRNIANLNKILELEKDANYHLDAGDANLAIEFLLEKEIISVKGNTDFFSKLEEEKILDIAGKKILLIHGHTLKVKRTMELLHSYAKGLNVDICIYGHTHIQRIEIVDDIVFINPGSVMDFKYAIYENGKFKLY